MTKRELGWQAGFSAAMTVAFAVFGMGYGACFAAGLTVGYGLVYLLTPSE